jgi:biopolymer transport protein TolQ
MSSHILFAQATPTSQWELLYVWNQATIEAKAIIFILGVFSIVAWSTIISKAMQMGRARRLNQLFTVEFRNQKHVLDMYDRQITAEGCPLFAVYLAGSQELDQRLKQPQSGARRRYVSLKGMEHVKRTLENAVAQESLKLESGLILLAIAVSGGPFLGLLGTVWGVMSTFGHVAQQQNASLVAMAPGVAAALITTVAGLLVAIPSMFGYNWLVHNLRVATVELDNFAQELVSQMETEYLLDEDISNTDLSATQPAAPVPLTSAAHSQPSHPATQAQFAAAPARPLRAAFAAAGLDGPVTGNVID